MLRQPGGFWLISSIRTVANMDLHGTSLTLVLIIRKVNLLRLLTTGQPCC